MNDNLVPPAAIGMQITDVDTPALLLNLDVFENNRIKLKKQLTQTKTNFRPHSKSHKCPSIAKLQLEDGAIGICCQKVSEAEIMSKAGIRDILISNQIVGSTKIQRLVKLSKSASILVCVDNKENINEINKYAKMFDTRIGVLVELDVGTHRCGVVGEFEVLKLVKLISSYSNLDFVGIQAYQGKAQHVRKYNARKLLVENASQAVKRALDLLRENNFSCKVVSGGGTGTFNFEVESDVFNEVQPGSYVFMDGDYGRNLDAAGETIDFFGQSLFLLTTVMSLPSSGRAVVDVGLKSVAVDSGLPDVCLKGVNYVSASDEHGVLEIPSLNDLKLGDKIKLIPGHCDPTVNLHDWIVGYRDDKVELIWDIAARGAFF